MKKLYALVCLGSALLCAAVLAHTYAYPRLAVVPADLDTRVSVETPQPATYFSMADLKERKAGLRSTTHARIDRTASTQASQEVGREVQVLEVHSCTDLATVDCSRRKYAISASLRRFAVDAATGEAVTWSGSSVETGGTKRTGVSVRGYTVKLPFDVEQKTYPMWNADLGRTVDATFEGEADLQGLRVYRFRTEVPATVVKKLELPGSLIGRDEPTVTADQVTSSTTTLLVEPETGVILSAASSQDGYAQVDGRRVLTTIRGSFAADDQTIAADVEEYQTLSRQLHLLRVVIPLGAGVVGAVLLVLGLVLQRRHSAVRRRDHRLEAGAA